MPLIRYHGFIDTWSSRYILDITATLVHQPSHVLNDLKINWKDLISSICHRMWDREESSANPRASVSGTTNQGAGFCHVNSWIRAQIRYILTKLCQLIMEESLGYVWWLPRDFGSLGPLLRSGHLAPVSPLSPITTIQLADPLCKHNAHNLIWIYSAYPGNKDPWSPHLQLISGNFPQMTGFNFSQTSGKVIPTVNRVNRYLREVWLLPAILHSHWSVKIADKNIIF